MRVPGPVGVQSGCGPTLGSSRVTRKAGVWLVGGSQQWPPWELYGPPHNPQAVLMSSSALGSVCVAIRSCGEMVVKMPLPPWATCAEDREGSTQNLGCAG